MGLSMTKHHYETVTDTQPVCVPEAVYICHISDGYQCHIGSSQKYKLPSPAEGLGDGDPAAEPRNPHL